MHIQAKVYTRIAILNLTDKVSEDHVISLDSEMMKLAVKIPSIIVLIDAAEFEQAASMAILKIRDRYAANKNKNRLFIVSSKLTGADAKDLVSALDLIGTSDSDKVTAYFIKDKKLNDLTVKVQKTALKASNFIRTALELPNDDKPLEAAAFSQALIKVKDFNKQLEATYRALGSEIAALKKQRLKTEGNGEIDSDSQDRLNEAKKKALAVMKSAGLL